LLHEAVSVIALPVNGELLLAEIVHAGALVGAGCQLTVALAEALGPAAFDAMTLYDAAPAELAVAEQVEPVELQLVHCQDVGLLEHFAVSVTVEPTVGVELLTCTEQLGTGCVCHATVAAAGALVPIALLATTVNAFAPAVLDDVVHDELELVQPVQAYDVGLPLQLALSTTESPTIGVVVLAVSEHSGADGVVVPPLPCHSASNPTRAPRPALLDACSA
jgi:hypothetical protein